MASLQVQLEEAREKVRLLQEELRTIGSRLTIAEYDVEELLLRIRAEHDSQQACADGGKK